MNNTQVLQSMALDLKRVALGYHSGSQKMADVFLQHILEQKRTLNMNTLHPYVQKILERIEALSQIQNCNKQADEALTYSTLLLSFSK